MDRINSIRMRWEEMYQAPDSIAPEDVISYISKYVVGRLIVVGDYICYSYSNNYQVLDYQYNLDDVLQSIAIVLHDSYSRYLSVGDEDIACCKTYCCNACYYAVLRYAQQFKPKSSVSIDKVDSASLSYQAPESKLNQLHLYHHYLRQHLSKRDADLLMLRANGYKDKDVAEMYNMTKTHLTSVRSRAYGILRDVYSNKQEEVIDDVLN